MISEVTARGALRFAVFHGTTTAKIFIEFRKGLLHDAPGPVYLMVDGHPATAPARSSRNLGRTTGLHPARHTSITQPNDIV